MHYHRHVAACKEVIQAEDSSHCHAGVIYLVKPESAPWYRQLVSDCCCCCCNRVAGLSHVCVMTSACEPLLPLYLVVSCTHSMHECKRSLVFRLFVHHFLLQAITHWRAWAPSKRKKRRRARDIRIKCDTRKRAKVWHEWSKYTGKQHAKHALQRKADSHYRYVTTAQTCMRS